MVLQLINLIEHNLMNHLINYICSPLKYVSSHEPKYIQFLKLILFN